MTTQEKAILDEVVAALAPQIPALVAKATAKAETVVDTQITKAIPSTTHNVVISFANAELEAGVAKALTWFTKKL